MIRINRKDFDKAELLILLQKSRGVPIEDEGKKEITFINENYYTPINQSEKGEIWKFKDYVEIR